MIQKGWVGGEKKHKARKLLIQSFSLLTIVLLYKCSRKWHTENNTAQLKYGTQTQVEERTITFINIS